jgi:UDP-glucose:(glucosyl)LPS alpha-1,2-glucosyltransferase
MSTIFDGEVIESPESKNAMGGTEQMRKRFLENVEPYLYRDMAIHLSRPQKMHHKRNIFWAHDLPDDAFNALSQISKFDHYVFVTAWQRDMFLRKHPGFFQRGSVHVIENAIEKFEAKSSIRRSNIIKFVYHTTPHRGLEEAATVFETLRNRYGKYVEFHVFSSFKVYGWQNADAQFQGVFDKLSSIEGVTLHGAKPNAAIRKFLSEEATAFLYPCKWQETSCIAAVEAMAAGIPIIHPNFAALPETAAGSHLSWSFDAYGDMVAAATSVADKFVMEYADLPLERLAPDHRYAHTIEHFTEKWSTLLKEINFGKR